MYPFTLTGIDSLLQVLLTCMGLLKVLIHSYNKWDSNFSSYGSHTPPQITHSAIRALGDKKHKHNRINVYCFLYNEGSRMSSG